MKRSLGLCFFLRHAISLVNKKPYINAISTTNGLTARKNTLTEWTSGEWLPSPNVLLCFPLEEGGVHGPLSRLCSTSGRQHIMFLFENPHVFKKRWFSTSRMSLFASGLKYTLRAGLFSPLPLLPCPRIDKANIVCVLKENSGVRERFSRWYYGKGNLKLRVKRDS